MKKNKKMLSSILIIVLISIFGYPIQKTSAANDTSWEASLAYGKKVSIMRGSENKNGSLQGLVDGDVSNSKGKYFRLNSDSLDAERWTWVQVDLGKKQAVNFFKVYTYKLYKASPHSYIKTIRIEGAENLGLFGGKTFKTILPDVSPEKGEAYPDDTVLEFKAPTKVTVRYIRLWIRIVEQVGKQMFVPALREFGVYNIDESQEIEQGAGGQDGSSLPLDAKGLDISQEKVQIPTGNATVVPYPLPACYSASSSFAVTVEGENIPVIRYDDHKNTEYHYAHFSFSGTAQIRVTAKKNITSYKIRPESYGLKGTVSGRNLTFALSRSRYLLINIDNMQNLVIIADPLETNIPPASGTGIYNVKSVPYHADNTGSANMTNILQRAIDNASSAGGGTVYVPSGVYQISSLTMKSNVHLYLEGGAVLRGTGIQSDYVKENPRSNSQSMTTFINFAEGASNLKIYGRGTLDCNGEALYDNGGGRDPGTLRICGLRPNKNSNVIIDGIIVSHGRTWTVAPQQSDNIIIQNVKVFNSENRSENDGIDINSCQDVLVQHCFTYTNDDSLCVKACNSKSFKSMIIGPPEDVYNITFDDIVTYGRCAGTKVGMQGITRTYNVWFKNIEVLRASRGIAIQHGQGKEIVEGIHFININIEDLVRRTYDPYPIEMQISAGGKVRNIEVTNVNFNKFGDGTSKDGFNGANSVITGQSDASKIENVTFTNLKIAGKDILNSSSGRITINRYTSEITFAAKDAPKDFATFKDLDSVPWAKQYIETLAAAGLVSAVGDGIFAPDRPVECEEFVKMVIGACGLKADSATTELIRKGIGASITQQDMCVMANRALEMAGIKLLKNGETAAVVDEPVVTGYAKESVALMRQAGILSSVGNNQFIPEANATRAQAAVVLSKIYINRIYYREPMDMTPVSNVRIDVGSDSSYTDKNGNEYVSDRYYAGDFLVGYKNNNITGTDDGLLYQTYRYGEEFSYHIPVVPGTYKVTLRMVEPAYNQKGKRIFSITLQGKAVVSNLDIAEEAGQFKAFDRSFIVAADDGKLTIELSASVNNAVISAIEVIRQ
jgi:polygalacturonase